jgi:hypothetical protein
MKRRENKGFYKKRFLAIGKVFEKPNKYINGYKTCAFKV